MQKILSEFVGTTFLLMVVVGSGVMGQTLFPGQQGLCLLANSLATGAGLFVLIQCLGPISGAHMNPVVSLVECFWKRLPKNLLIGYVIAQMSGAIVGTLMVHIMFGLPVFQISQTDRSGFHLFLSEIVATFGLISVVGLAGKKDVAFAPLSVALYITSAYWFTSSTSFANPAVSFGRMFTDTFTGIAPSQYLSFVLAQVSGAILAWAILRKLG